MHKYIHGSAHLPSPVYPRQCLPLPAGIEGAYMLGLELAAHLGPLVGGAAPSGGAGAAAAAERAFQEYQRR